MKFNKYVCEFLGTMFFLYVMIASGKPLAIAAALLVAILFVGPVSGAHLNPAVTVMMANAGKLQMNDVLPYILAQIAGGLAALELHRKL